MFHNKTDFAPHVVRDVINVHVNSRVGLTIIFKALPIVMSFTNFFLKIKISESFGTISRSAALHHKV